MTTRAPEFCRFTARGERDATEYARVVPPDLILLEFGRQGYDESFSLGRRVKEAAGLSAGVPLVVYAPGEDETAREGLWVEVAPREYVVLPDDDHDLAVLLSGLIAAV